MPATPPPMPRTDLALEAHEFLQTAGATREIPGVRYEEEQVGPVRISRVEVQTEEAERIMNKVRGRYVTIEAPDLRRRAREVEAEVSQAIARELGRLADFSPYNTIFVVGLGNWNATPDALGPRVVDHLLVTRHLHHYAPTELRGNLRSVCALAPGVLGTTGIETWEIIRGVAERIRPQLVVAVDALAARSLERIMTTVQIADTGIHPGSGVGSKRMGITQETMGIPVIALGVPSVVHAVVIAQDTINLLLNELRGQAQFYGIVGEMDQPEQRRLIEEVLSPYVGDLMVTPKEVDVQIEQMARVVADGLNAAFHPGISDEQAPEYRDFY